MSCYIYHNIIHKNDCYNYFFKHECISIKLLQNIFNFNVLYIRKFLLKPILTQYFNIETPGKFQGNKIPEKGKYLL